MEYNKIGNEVISKVKLFLQQYAGDKEILPNDELFSSGLINSMFAMQLVLFLEKEFTVKVANEDLDLKNFKSLNAIADFVEKKHANVAG